MFEQLALEITNRCNLDCFFCPMRFMRRERKSMDLSLFEKILIEVSEKKIAKNISLANMGEPLVHSHIHQILKISKKFPLNYYLPTNGTLLTEKLVKEISHFKEILISVHDYYFNQSKSYKKRILEAIRLSLKFFPGRILLRFRIFGFETLEGKIGDFNRSSKWLLEFLNEIKHYLNLSPLTKEEETKVLIQPIMEPLKMFGFEIAPSSLIKWPNPYTKNVQKVEHAYCPFIYNQFSILSNGDVVLCCYDFDGFTKIGNVKDTTITEIMQSAQKIYGEMFNGKLIFDFCKVCQARHGNKLALLNIKNILARQKGILKSPFDFL